MKWAKGLSFIIQLLEESNRGKKVIGVIKKNTCTTFWITWETSLYLNPIMLKIILIIKRLAVIIMKFGIINKNENPGFILK